MAQGNLGDGTLPICAKLTRKGYRREIWHEPDGTMDAPCEADDAGAEAYNINPDGPEAAELITELHAALCGLINATIGPMTPELRAALDANAKARAESSQ